MYEEISLNDTKILRNSSTLQLIGRGTDKVVVRFCVNMQIIQSKTQYIFEIMRSKTHSLKPNTKMFKTACVLNLKSSLAVYILIITYPTPTAYFFSQACLEQILVSCVYYTQWCNHTVNKMNKQCMSIFSSFFTCQRCPARNATCQL